MKNSYDHNLHHKNEQSEFNKVKINHKNEQSELNRVKINHKNQQSEFNRVKTRPRFGFLSCWFRGDYIFELLSGIEHEAKLKDVQIFYFAGRTILSPHPYENNYNIVYDAALDASLDGLVIMSMLNNYNIDIEMNEFLKKYSPIPLVTINFKTTHGNSILSNNDLGFRQLLKHLIEDHGYRKLGFINGPDNNFDAMMRFDIYKSMLNAYDIPLDLSLITSGYFDYFSGKKAIGTFLDERKLKFGRDMEVIVCASDESAWGVMDGLKARNIRVPTDIALTGFNDIRYIIFPKIRITTVRQHVFDIGRAAITNLLDFDPKRDDQIFNTELIIRTSCGCSGDDTIQSSGLKSIPPVKQKTTSTPDNRTATELKTTLTPDNRTATELKTTSTPDNRTATKLKTTLTPDNRTATKLKTISKKQQLTLNGKINRASVFIDGTVLENINGFEGDWKDLEFFFFEIISVMNNLKLLKNISELDEWMVQNLPILGIESAYLFLYSTVPSPSRFVRLIAGFDRKKQKQGDLEKIYPLATVFDEILTHLKTLQSDDNKRLSYCILPILYKDEQYGLLAIEVNVYSSIANDTLSSQIGNSIKSMLLMEEVKTMNEKLRHANEQKTRFFINVAHETKTPLTLIQNYLERSIKRHASDPDLLIVKQNIDVLLENMLNFLDVERLEKGTMTYSHDSYIDLSESVRKKCALFRSVAVKKNIIISVQVESNSVIKIDPCALDRILNNLLDNAVKYTHAGGKVWVTVKNIAGNSELCVSDNGPGLSGDTIEHMFEPYYQLSRKRSSKQGIGVGLSIVKKIIDDLGASITVRNKKRGGACFVCKFAVAKESAEEKHLGSISISESLFGQPSAGIVFQEDITEEDISGDKESILIVDDNIQMLNFLKVSLKKSYNVFLSTDVPTALAKLKTIDPPELIISDIMMDGMDGHALLAILTGTDAYCDIPFIFLTAASNKDEEIRGLSGGAIDYIKKPFSITELEKKIESIIALRKRMKKREILNIRKGIDSLFSGIEGTKNQNPGTIFDSLCIEYSFSIREREIIKLLLEGLLNKEIAFQLNLSKRAIEYHITNIYKKVGVSKRYELVSKFKS